MTDIDQVGTALRDELLVAARRAPAPDGLADRLAAEVPASVAAGGAARRSRRGWVRPVAAAAAAIALVVGVTSVVAQHRSPAKPAIRPAVVPWNPVDQRPLSVPLEPPHAIAPLPKEVGAPKGMRACNDTDFRLIGSQSEPVRDVGIFTSFSLESISTSSCSVSNRGLFAELVDATGTALPNDLRVSGSRAFPSDLLVKPGQLVTGSVQWLVVQAKAQRPVAIALLSPGPDYSHPDTGLSISIGNVSAPPDPPNPSNVGPWRAGWWSMPPAVHDPGQLSSLVVNIIGPSSVAAGPTLHAQVQLENRTAYPVHLTPCPKVQVELEVEPVTPSSVAGTHGPLNCAQAPQSVPPGGSVTFAVAVPTAGEPAGSGQLSFLLVVDDRAVVQGTTNVAVAGQG